MIPATSLFLAAIPPMQLAILGFYFALLISVAIAFKRLNRDADDYFRSGCRGRWWLVGMSVYMSAFSAWSFTGLAGVAYEAGWTGLQPFLSNVLGFLINALFLAAWFRQLRVTTHPDVVRDRFGVLTEQVFSWHGTIFGLFYAGITLYTVCIFLTSVFKFDLQATIIATGGAVLFYSLVGGRWAVMGNDFLQGIFLVPICLLTAGLCLMKVGGVEGLLEGIRAEGLEDTFQFVKSPQEEFGYKYTSMWIMASTVGLLIDRLGIVGGPRYFSARDGREAKRAAWLVTGLMLLSMVIFFIPPVVARLCFQGEVEAMAGLGVEKLAETSYAVAAMNVLPEGLMGLMVVAILAATVSAMDTGLNMFAAIFTKNVYPAICRVAGWKVVGPGAQLHIGQGITLVSGLAAIALALHFSQLKGQGAFELMLNMGALFGAPMSAPMILGMFTRKAPGHAALWSMLIGFLVAIFAANENWLYEWKVFGVLAAGCAGYFLAYKVPGRYAHGAIWMFASGMTAAGILWLLALGGWTLPFAISFGISTLSALAGFAGALRWPVTPDENEPHRIAEFFQRMRTPVDFQKEIGDRPGPDAQARILGIFSLIIGMAILLLMIPDQSNGWSGRLGVAAVAAVPLLVGMALLHISRPRV